MKGYRNGECRISLNDKGVILKTKFLNQGEETKVQDTKL